MKTKLTLLFILTAVVVLPAHSQNYSISGVKRVYIQNTGVFKDNLEAKGYFSFFRLDKGKTNKKGDQYFNLVLLDNDMKETNAIEMIKPKKYMLVENSYNGDKFCFSFLDAKARKIEYVVMDKSGNEVGSYTPMISKQELNIYLGTLQTEDDMYDGGLVPITGKGFARFGYEKQEGTRVSIEMFDNSGNVKWEAKSGEAAGDKSFESCTPYYSDDKVIIAGLSTREKLLSVKNSKFSTIFLNVDNGNEYFRLDNKTDEYLLYPLGVSFNTFAKTYFIYGQYWGIKDSPSNDDPIGMYMQQVDLTGKIVSQGFSSWNQSINIALAKKSKGKMEKSMKVFIHKIVGTADGKIYAIGEQYRKAVDGGAIALSVAVQAAGGTSNASMIKIELHDMVIMEFNSDLTFNDAYLFEKQKTNVHLSKGQGIADANALAFLLKREGAFDYSFTTVSPDYKSFYCTYTNYDRQKASKYTIGTIGFDKDKKLVQNKINLTSKPSQFMVLEAKSGFVGIFEYFSKEKKSVMRLEKLQSIN